MMCPRCNGDIRPWGVCQCDEKILKARIASLEAENQWLREENAELCGYDSWEEKERERQRAILGGGG